MSIELKQAAEKALVVLGSATSFMSRKARDQHESVVAELRTALSQQPDNAACKSVQKRIAAQQPATGEPVGYMNEGHIHELAMRRLPYGYVYPEAGAGASTAVYTHPAPSVPDDVVRVPMQILKDASEALGNFVSDHGWGDADMQAMDNLDAYIARHEANRAAMLAAK